MMDSFSEDSPFCFFPVASGVLRTAMMLTTSCLNLWSSDDGSSV